MNNTRITFIGAGNITQAMVAGLIANQYNPQHIWVTNPSPEKLTMFRQQWGVHTSPDNRRAVEQADIVVLAAKPMIIPGICAEIKDLISHHQPLLIPVAVGTTVALITKWLGTPAAIIRAMPNTPARVGAGTTGLYAGDQVSSAQKNLAEALFRAVGITIWLEDEAQLDWVCALSACGPGYIFLLMESIEAAAIQLGLPADAAHLLASQTFLGAARIALESDCSFVELRQQVVSPKGPTEKIVQVLEEGQIRALFVTAIAAAVRRNQEITQLLMDESE